MYCIIIFMKTNEVEIVPEAWITKDGELVRVQWPPYRNTTQITTAVKTCAEPNQLWKSFDVRILKNFDSYELADKFISKAQIHSELDTEVSDCDVKEPVTLTRIGRIRKPNPIYETEDDDEEPPKKSCREKNLRPNLPHPPPVSPPESHSTPKASFNTSALLSPFGIKTCSLSNSSILTRASSTSIATELGIHPIPSACETQTLSSSSVNRIRYSPPASFTRASKTFTTSRSRAISSLTASDSVRRLFDTNMTSEPIFQGTTQPSCDNYVVSAVDKKKLEMLEQIRQQGQTLIVLVQQLLMTRTENISTDFEFSLPVTTLQELELLNDHAQDADLRGKLTRFLGLVGGSSNPETVRNVMKRLMTSSVAQVLNWRGKRGKHSFNKMIACTIVCDAVRRNPSTCRATDADISITIKEWLKHARDREGGRARRSGTTAAQSHS